MITFKGSQKAFFKAYPKEKRSLDEVYCLVSYNVIAKRETKTCYQFIGSLCEKSFKKVETPKAVDKVEDVTIDTNDTNVSNVQSVKAEETVKDVSQEKLDDGKEKETGTDEAKG